MRRLSFPTLLCALLVLGASRAHAAELFRTPPPGYEQRIAPRFTPLEKVLKQKDVFSVKDGDSATLLDETVDFVDDNGRVVAARHLIKRSFNDAGSKEVATQS
ncbi:MAG: hypothetical protein ACREKL_08310, partial [Chthoniobacterales bacterium]